MFLVPPHIPVLRSSAAEKGNAKDQAGLAYMSTSPVQLASAPALVKIAVLSLPPLKAMTKWDSADVINDSLLNFRSR